MTEKKKKKKKKKKWLIRDAFLSTLLSLGVFYLLALLVLNSNFFNPFVKVLKDFNFLDIYYSEKFDGGKKIHPNIILINAGKVDRSELGLLIQQIKASDPAVIGLDIIFEDRKHDSSDTILSSAIDDKRLVTPYTMLQDGIVESDEFFQKKTQKGFVNFGEENVIGVVRSFEGVKTKDDEKNYAFATQIAFRYFKDDESKKNTIEAKLKRSRRIKYYGHYDRFLNFTVKELLELENKSLLKDKIVLIGYLGSPTGSPNDVEDKHFTPLNTTTSGKSIPDMYGATIHANIVNMIVGNDFFTEIHKGIKALLIFICAFFSSYYFIWLDRKLKISYRTVRKTVLLVFAICLTGISIFLFSRSIVLDPLLIIMTTFFSAGFVKYYKHLVRYINTKRTFKSYLK